MLTALMLASLAQAAPSSSYTYLDDCEFEADGSAQDEDWVRYACEGYAGTRYWLTYHDSRYMNLSFGTRGGESAIYLLADRNPRWPLEWRHRDARPYAVIARMVRPDLNDLSNTVTSLFVYGLRASGSCILGDTSSNEEARRIADRYGQTGQCPR